MSVLSSYFISLYRSCTDPEYYLTLLGSPLRNRIAFFWTTVLLFALLLLPYWHFHLIPDFLSQARTEGDQLIAQIPQTAVFAIQENTLSVEGATLPIQIFSTEKMQSYGIPKNLIEVRLDTTEMRFAMTFLPKEILMVGQTQGSSLSYADIAGVLSTPFDADDIRSLFQRNMDRISQERLLLSSGLSLGFLLSQSLVGIGTILFYSLLIEGLGWLIGSRINYLQAVRWGLHVFPIALGLSGIVTLILPESQFPMLTVAYLSISLLILLYMRTRFTVHFSK